MKYPLFIFFILFQGALGADCPFPKPEQDLYLMVDIRYTKNKACCGTPLRAMELRVANEENLQNDRASDSAPTTEDGKKARVQGAIEEVLQGRADKGDASAKVDLDRYHDLLKAQKASTNEAKGIAEALKAGQALDPKNPKALIDPQRGQQIQLENGFKLLAKKIQGKNLQGNYQETISLANEQFEQLNSIRESQIERETQECRKAKAEDYYKEDTKNVENHGGGVGSILRERGASIAKQATAHSSEGFVQVWSKTKALYKGQKFGLTEDVINRVEYIRDSCYRKTLKKPSELTAISETGLKKIEKDITTAQGCIRFIHQQLMNTTSAEINLKKSACESYQSQLESQMKALSGKDDKDSDRLLTDQEIKDRVTNYMAVSRSLTQEKEKDLAAGNAMQALLEKYALDLAKDKKYTDAIKENDGASPAARKLNAKNRLSALKTIKDDLRELMLKTCNDDYCPDCGPDGKPKPQSSSSGRSSGSGGGGQSSAPTINVQGDGATITLGNSTTTNSGKSAGQNNSINIKQPDSKSSPPLNINRTDGSTLGKDSDDSSTGDGKGTGAGRRRRSPSPGGSSTAPDNTGVSTDSDSASTDDTSADSSDASTSSDDSTDASSDDGSSTLSTSNRAGPSKLISSLTPSVTPTVTPTPTPTPSPARRTRMRDLPRVH